MFSIKGLKMTPKRNIPAAWVFPKIVELDLQGNFPDCHHLTARPVLGARRPRPPRRKRSRVARGFRRGGTEGAVTVGHQRFDGTGTPR